MPIQSVSRALDILEYLSIQENPVPLKRLSQQFGLRETTCYALVRALAERGYINHVGSRGGYELGWKVKELFLNRGGRNQIAELARPRMEDLRHDLGNESCFLGYFRDDSVIPIVQVLSTQMLACGSISETKELHATCSGKVILASMDPSAVKAWIARHGLPKITPKTITSPQALMMELAKVRSQGFATHFEENVPGMVAIAVPVQTAKFPLFTLYFAMPLVRYEPRKLEDYVHELKRAAADIAEILNNVHAESFD